MNNIGINVQPSTVLPGEWETIKERYPAGILAIIDWPNALAALPADANVTMWRFTQDPRNLPGWPGALVARCKLAVFANEPDIEGGYPAWYAGVCRQWATAGGHVACPAFADEHQYSQRSDPYDGQYDVLTWHDYAGDFTNRRILRAEGGDNETIYVGTEYAVPNDQRRCLIDLAAAGITETVYLFIWRWQGQDRSDDLAGVTMAQPTQQAQPVERSFSARQWRCTAYPLNPDAAIYKSWLDNREAVGIPISGEQPQADGTTVQFFSNAVAVWDGEKVEWK